MLVSLLVPVLACVSLISDLRASRPDRTPPPLQSLRCSLALLRRRFDVVTRAAQCFTVVRVESSRVIDADEGDDVVAVGGRCHAFSSKAGLAEVCVTAHHDEAHLDPVLVIPSLCWSSAPSLNLLLLHLCAIGVCLAVAAVRELCAPAYSARSLGA